MKVFELLLDKLNFSAGFRRYIFNTIWLFAEKFLGGAAVIFVGIWIARYLGPSDFGKLSFAQNLVMLFSVFATFGLIRILDRDLASKSKNREQIINTSIVLILIGASAVYGLLLTLLWIRGYEETTSQLIVIIGLGAFFQVNRVYTAYYYSQVKARKVVIATVFALLFSNAIKIAMIFLEAPISFFALTVILDSVVLLPVLIFISRNNEAKLRLRVFSFASAQNLLKDSWPYIFSGFLATLYLKLDTIMIKEMIGDYSAGQYAAAARLSEGFHYIAITLMASIYPAIVKSKEKSESEYYARLSSLYSFLFLLSTAIAIAVGISSEKIISMLYGSAYSEAANVLLIHVWSCVFFYLGVCSGRWLLTERLQVLVALNSLLGALLNLGLNLYLIPSYGIIGAAWATMISYCFVAYLSFVIWKRTRPNFLLMTRSFFKIPRLNW